MTSKRNLLDALRDPHAADLVRPREAPDTKKPARKPTKAEVGRGAAMKKAATKVKAKKKPKKKARKKAKGKPRPRLTAAKAVVESWPPGWALAKDRCRGFTRTNSQCGRRSATKTFFCGAHRDQSMEHVSLEFARRIGDRARLGSATASGGGPKSAPAPDQAPKGIRDIPEDRMCKAVIDSNNGSSRVCGQWTFTIEEGRFDAYCLNHSQDPRAVRACEIRAAKGSQHMSALNEYNSSSKKPIFNRECKTQDDVAEARMILLRKLETGEMKPAHFNAAIGGLDRVSSHIERYGAHQGSEGGAGVLRLLPGTTLIQKETEVDTIITKAQLLELEERMAADEREGEPVPEDFTDVMEKYLGVKVRKRDRSRNYEEE
jgi:hypothetical protein